MTVTNQERLQFSLDCRQSLNSADYNEDIGYPASGFLGVSQKIHQRFSVDLGQCLNPGTFSHFTFVLSTLLSC
jgi:hypothetical protein